MQANGYFVMTLIFHITDRAQWQTAQAAGEYRHDSLEAEGFIHCSTAQQLAWVANTFFQGQHSLLLLEIASDRLTSELRYDEVPEAGVFPHIYGPINLDAVNQVIEFEPNAAGEFCWPMMAEA